MLACQQKWDRKFGKKKKEWKIETRAISKSEKDTEMERYRKNIYGQKRQMLKIRDTKDTHSHSDSAFSCFVPLEPKADLEACKEVTTFFLSCN